MFKPRCPFHISHVHLVPFPPVTDSKNLPNEISLVEFEDEEENLL